MNEKKKHKIMLGIEVVLLCMIVAILGTNAASSNPPSNGVSYGKNNQDTVEGALNDLYDKANYGNASAGSILSGHTALVGGNRVTGTMPDRTNNTGTLGLAWSTSDYQMMGTQLRIGVSPGYYGTNNYWTWGTSGIVFDNYQQKLGITADKIVKGQSIAGINGTGGTSCPSCSCPEWKVYSVHQKQATVTESYKTYNGSLVDMIGDGKHSKFEIDLGFTPSQVGDLYVKMFSHVSNYFQISSSTGNWQMDFLYCHTAPSVNGVQRFHNSSTNNSINVSCNVLGSKVILDVWGDSKIKTNASTFLMDVLLRYK
jgi:hypothetical protein